MYTVTYCFLKLLSVGNNVLFVIDIWLFTEVKPIISLNNYSIIMKNYRKSFMSPYIDKWLNLITNITSLLRIYCHY